MFDKGSRRPSRPSKRIGRSKGTRAARTAKGQCALGYAPRVWVPSLNAGVLAAAEMAEPGQRCEERDQRGQRQESLHLHSRHLLLEVEVLERLRRPAVQPSRLAVVALPPR
jgi:hypothetical protein